MHDKTFYLNLSPSQVGRLRGEKKKCKEWNQDVRLDSGNQDQGSHLKADGRERLKLLFACKSPT